jgi:uncharacterized protein (TIGR02118 family)
MFKLILLTKRHPSLTMAEFIKHYENTHAPMNVRLYPQMRKYERNYIEPVEADMPQYGDSPFDCVTEVLFDREEDFKQVMRDMETNTSNTEEHLADEEILFDRSKVWWFTSTQYNTDFG